MNISGILIQCKPEQRTAVFNHLSSMAGVDVHHVEEDGRMIVTIEDDDARESGDTMVKISLLSGVIAASLVYHHFEPDTDFPQLDSISSAQPVTEH